MVQEIKNELELALVQTDVFWEDVDANLNHLGVILKNLKSTTDVVILTEAFTSGFSMDAKKVAQNLDGKALVWMKEIAVQKNVAVCGSLFVFENAKYYNRFVWVFPNGEMQFYDKRHLFSIEKENVNYSCGKSQLLIEYKGWKIFPQICYDLRFPVWARNTMGYDLMINVANWPAARSEVWKTLLKARAIENQCYVAAVNRVGTDKNPIEHSGDTMIVDYKGQVTHNAYSEQIILCGSVSLDALHTFRKKFNTLIDADRFTIEIE